MLVWGAPQEPNGDVIRYDVTYRIDGGELATTSVDLNTIFAFPELPTGTIISDISVTAYTRVGPGEITNLPDVVIPEKSLFLNLVGDSDL